MSYLNEPRIKPKLERFADAMTHGVSLIFSAIAFFLLIYKSFILEDKWIFLSLSIYGLSLMSAYLSSTIYHLYLYYHPVPNKKFRRYLLLFDHFSIFFLIAGTYTPILLIFMRTKVGFTLLGLIWFLTFSGIVYKIYFIGRFKKFSVFMYTTMGWLIILSIKDVIRLVPHDLIKYLLAGGIFYSIGIIFYQKKLLEYNHSIWHILVLLGSTIHFFGMLFCIK